MAEVDKTIDVQLPPLKESVAAYQRASHLPEQVTQRMRQVEETTERHLSRAPTAHRQSISPDALATISLIRNRRTVRQAVIASLIFGAPKALETVETVETESSE